MAVIYLAAAYSRAAEMRTVADVLRGDGHEITARWIEGKHDVPPAGIEPGSREHDAWAAQDDLDDIDRSECIVSFTGGGNRSRGGRHVEFGYGLARGLRMVIVGEREPVFHGLPQVQVVANLDEARALLRQ